MKKSLLILLIFILVLSGCSDKIVKPDNAFNAADLMDNAILNQDFEKYQELLLESKRDKYTQEDLIMFGEKSGGGGDISNYYLYESPEGGMILYEVTTGDVDGTYYIQDIIVVPDEMKELFKGR